MLISPCVQNEESTNAPFTVSILHLLGFCFLPILFWLLWVQVTLSSEHVCYSGKCSFTGESLLCSQAPIPQFTRCLCWWKERRRPPKEGGSLLSNMMPALSKKRQTAAEWSGVLFLSGRVPIHNVWHPCQISKRFGALLLIISTGTIIMYQVMSICIFCTGMHYRLHFRTCNL